MFKLYCDSEFSNQQKTLFQNYLIKTDNSKEKSYGLLTISSFLYNDKKTVEFLDEFEQKLKTSNCREMKAVLNGINSTYRSEEQLNPVKDFIKIDLASFLLKTTFSKAKVIFDGFTPESEKFNEMIVIMGRIQENISSSSPFFQHYINEKIAILKIRKDVHAL